ncbi:hypothetical protein LIX87_03265 [Weissella viridescens]|uniref:hypothetical protein n=1 Tax=Weissella viridescens TaxID=1629 RepID=UPI001D082978|nr:hypothetical protein [Weissella viridescens]MCB6839995.1 hypothetical protein [Weissella viridescens]MCB6846771.1 hypothetical protein [Weissella viridescens]
MDFITLLNIIIAVIAGSVIFITRSIVWHRVLKVRRNPIPEMTLVTFLKKYRFDPKEPFDRDTLNEFLSDINDNDFNHVLDELTEQANIVLDPQASEIEQEKRYKQMVESFNIIKKRFKKSMTRGELFIFDLRRVAVLTLAVAMTMLFANFTWVQRTGVIFHYRGLCLILCGFTLLCLGIVWVAFVFTMIKHLIR